MLTNCTILRIDTPGVPAADGEVPMTQGAAVSIRCSWQQPKYRRVFLVGVALEDVGAVIYVEGNQGDVYLVVGQVLLQVDGETATRLYTVMALVPQVGLSLTNTEIYLKKL